MQKLADVRKEDPDIANLSIWSKRKKIEEILFTKKCVAGFFSYITAMKVAELRLEQNKKKRALARTDPHLDSEDEANDYLGEDGAIPGLRIIFHFKVLNVRYTSLNSSFNFFYAQI